MSTQPHPPPATKADRGNARETERARKRGGGGGSDPAENLGWEGKGRRRKKKQGEETTEDGGAEGAAERLALSSSSTGCVPFSGGELKCLFPQKVATRQHFVFKASASCLPSQLARQTQCSLSLRLSEVRGARGQTEDILKFQRHAICGSCRKNVLITQHLQAFV